ncbi:hypothetical protein [Limnohabitans sp. Bal53]|uniref:hypothetical protein n=1 Tax=Limnohabitans sp. Bal53 TaxID=1977910 RepID=UPI000D36C8C9|nr:hypothetical protein [Limnohabitans sp. Bal53]
MTTYSFTLELSEQELWSVEEALKFYVTPEAAKLRAERPDLVRYAGLEHIYRILGTKKLYDQPQLTSSSSFVFLGNNSESDESHYQFVDMFSTISQAEKFILIEEVANALLVDPLPEFESAVFAQLFHSPTFQQRVINQLYEMVLSDTHLIKSILNVPKHAYWFHEQVAKKIHSKYLGT